MSSLPHLTESEIRAWSSEPSFSRGQQYFRQGAILDPRRAGMTLKAHCAGSRPQPYRVQVTLGPKGIIAGDCSCPVGAGGHCKHAVALLLTWLDDPEAFIEVEDLETALERRSKAELIALIRRMMGCYPELETLLELPAPGEGREQFIDAERIRRQVDHAFFGAGDEWDAVYGIVRELQDVVNVGHEYRQREEWRNATVIYQTVIQEILSRYETVHDEGGELGSVVNECEKHLEECLVGTADPAQREGILRTLFDTYAWDVDYGGMGMGDEVPGIILAQATPEERQTVAQWVRAAMPAGKTGHDDRERETYGGFLLDLEEDVLDDEAFLRICRETGRLHDLVGRLLKLGRTGEAVDEAQYAGDYDLLGLADIFVAHGHADLATKLIRERAGTSQDRHLIEWLEQRAVQRGDLTEALDWAVKLFWMHPNLGGYNEVKVLARELNLWADLRPQILARLAESQEHALLTEIHIQEGEVDHALEALGHITDPAYGWGYESLKLDVARAAEKKRPLEAIRLYTDVAKRLIQIRGRQNYATAVSCLGRVRELYQRLGQEGTWQSLITAIREENRRLRALKEELERAGL